MREPQTGHMIAPIGFNFSVASIEAEKFSLGSGPGLSTNVFFNLSCAEISTNERASNWSHDCSDWFKFQRSSVGSVNLLTFSSLFDSEVKRELTDGVLMAVHGSQKSNPSAVQVGS